MRLFLPSLALAALTGGCAVYPDGSLGPIPPAAPAYYPQPAYAPPPVAYAPPAYAQGPGAPVYYVPPPPPVVVTPSVGLGFYWGPGYWRRPYYGRRW